VRVRSLLATLALAAGLTGSASAEQSHLVIVVGLGGEPKYSEDFHQLAVAMIGAAEKKLGVAAANIAYLGEKTADAGLPVYRGRSTRENVQKALGDVATRARAGDLVMVLLIGHGSFQGGESRFNLPGPDMSAGDFAPPLAALGAQKVVLVNTASASGEFTKVLAGKDRTIVTATKSGMEGNDTEFARYFVDAFTDDKADADKDGRVSVREAFDYAHREVVRFYEKGRRLLTEHAVLEDGGGMASAMFLGTSSDAPIAGATGAQDPKLLELTRRRRELEEKIAALRSRKPQMASADYEDALETLLVELARSEDAIRRHEARR
jgi:hypothetical protein